MLPLPNLILLVLSLVPLSWQYRLVKSINSTNWMTEMDFVGKGREAGYTQWLTIKDALLGGNLGDGKNMAIKPDSNSTLGPKDQGRKSVALQSKFGLTSGIVVVDVLHVPMPACSMEAGIYLYNDRTPDKGPVRIIMSELVSWDPSNMMAYAPKGNNSMARIHKIPGKETFAGYANKNGGVIFVAKFNATDVQIWDLQGPQVPLVVPKRGSPPSDIDEKKLPESKWNKKDGGIEVKLDGPMRFTFEISFCESNVMRQFESKLPQNPGLSSDFPNVCKPTGLTCKQMAATRPFDFKDVYWEINGIWFYADK